MRDPFEDPAENEYGRSSRAGVTVDPYDAIKKVSGGRLALSLSPLKLITLRYLPRSRWSSEVGGDKTIECCRKKEQTLLSFLCCTNFLYVISQLATFRFSFLLLDVCS